jgi:hypothetical protein
MSNARFFLYKILNYYLSVKFHKNQSINKSKINVTQSRTGLQIYEGRDDQLNRPGPMA